MFKHSTTHALLGFRLPLEGARLLLRERRLWGLALVPMVLSLAAVCAAIAMLVTWAGEIHAALTGWMPALAAGHWLEWLWVGPARLVLTLLGWLLFVVAAAVCVAAAYLAAGLLASPFHDALAQRVERIVSGAAVDETAPGVRGALREGLRALREEIRRLAFFLAVVGPLAALGLAVPGAQLLTGPAITGFAVFFLSLDYASYALDRRRLSFAEKRRWLLAHRSAALGFGSAAFLLCVVPLLNAVAMPVLVVSGTLLVVRLPPEPSSPVAPTGV